MFGQACRECGCTEDDCRQCIAHTGEPCYWVDEDLCSACADSFDKKKVDVRVEFKDRLGGAHVATFGTWLTPGNEEPELKKISEYMLDSNGFKEATITKTEFKEA